MKSLLLWVRRGRVGVGPGDVVLGHAAERVPLLVVMACLLALETAVVGLLVPWPVVHVLDVCAVVQVLVVLARSVTRPHVLRADSLVLRDGGAFEVVVPLRLVAAVRVRREHHTGFRSVRRDGTEVVVVSGDQTTVRLDLAEPLDVVLPGGARCATTALRCHADDPAAAVAAISACARA
ncbi:MAG TPA: hypothetical protein VNO31_50160 [Umezawaea sp.]|nr:hypothetical protein [Umezawaea sp.]